MNDDRLPPFPPEIIRDYILIHLSIDDLQICAKVSTVWQKLASEIVRERVKKISDIIPSKTFQEMKTMTRVSAAGDFVQEEGQGGIDLSGFPDISTEDAAVLNTYERTFVPLTFSLGCDDLTGNDNECSNGILESWIRSYAKVRGCGCNNEMEEIKCLISSLRFFPKYSLIVVPVTDNLAFFHEEDPDHSLFLTGLEHKYLTPYIIEPIEFLTSLNPHSCVSIYGERFVAQETVQSFILCRVISVDHQGRCLEIERSHRIFYHFWSISSLLLYKETVYIIGAVGELMFWNEKTDALAPTFTSRPLIPNVREYPELALFRINNLIMVKFSCGVGVDVINIKHFNPPIWIMFDGDKEEFNKITVKMPEDLVRHVLPHLVYSVASVNRIDIWNNALIVQISFAGRCNVPGGCVPTERMIFTFPMKRDPELNDFECRYYFDKLNLFQSVSDKTTPYFSILGTTTGPFQVIKRKTSSNKAGMILEYPLHTTNEIFVHNLSIRCKCNENESDEENEY